MANYGRGRFCTLGLEARLAGEPGNQRQVQDRALTFGRWARAAWPVKPSECLRQITGRSLRTCKYWLADSFAPTLHDFLQMLKTAEGRALLDHAFGEDRPKWWERMRKGERTLTALQQLDSE